MPGSIELRPDVEEAEALLQGAVRLRFAQGSGSMHGSMQKGGQIAMALLSSMVRMQVQERLRETGFTDQHGCGCSSKDGLCSKVLGVLIRKNCKPRVVCEGLPSPADLSMAKKCQAGNLVPCGLSAGESKPVAA